MIVIDVGAATHGRDSIAILNEMYHPQVIWAFDPHPYLDGPAHVNGVSVIRYRKAAWTYSGTVAWTDQGSRSHVGGKSRVECFSLASLIESINPPVVLKLDVEGAEFVLLRHLIKRGVDERLHELWVEWHSPDQGRAEIEAAIRCPLKEWPW